jgi:hypothetical protein
MTFYDDQTVTGGRETIVCQLEMCNLITAIGWGNP